MLIEPSEGPAFAVRHPGGTSDVVLVCEHASKTMPKALGTLGLDPAALASHIAWDIGALGVAERLSDLLDATLITQRFSRLAYDCNRPPESADAYPERSEVFDVPGNHGLDQRERSRRAAALYVPFHQAIDTLIDERLAQGRAVVLVTVHSFTPVYFGKPRDGLLGILHDADQRLADAMLDAAAEARMEGVSRNYPYGPEDGVTHTLKRHGLTRQIANVMLEIRNDLISGEAGQTVWADRIAGLLRAALDRLNHQGGRRHA
ncbi:N-formylglutamate amidohydrolase [Hoeflea sp. BAL378]|uniref:N-formylglutamate amidohydrolase n=1 Tax=Hoeflea sp. BAL378 TaxID=1547437 RepID=UPI0005146024|nr:N-formylglutamate amidohydrolase [Hoeflea sp. BAL378]KGF69644.1 N-formylglutamate amidohydrolase [Hoeflea sp. BAL378]